ncbi:MAG: hypothetical protein H0W08_04835 [Acidobacteria bacterium]|nr:hypothetical protein [Acidobacteriota bacterium]
MNQTKVDGYPTARGEDVTVHMSHVGPNYFRTLGSRVVKGRECRKADNAAAPAVGVVNEARAQKYWAGRDPIGGRFEQYGGWITAIGIVENAVTTEVNGSPVPFAYLAFNQSVTGQHSVALDPVHLFVRTQDQAADAVATVARIASYIPARPAARLNPVAALRDD